MLELFLSPFNHDARQRHFHVATTLQNQDIIGQYFNVTGFQDSFRCDRLLERN